MAREAPAATLVEHAAVLLARIDAGGQPPREELAEPKSEFRYRRDAAGWMHFSGRIEPESAEGVGLHAGRAGQARQPVG
jgi:hypothetical protein